MTIYQQIIEAGKRATPRPWSRASGRTTEAVVADCRDYDSVEQVRYGGSPVADCDTNPHCGSTERENDDNADYIALAANHADKMAERLQELAELVPQLLDDLADGKSVKRSRVERVMELLSEQP